MQDLGAVWLDAERVRFRVWAPRATGVELHLLAPEDRILPMEAQTRGYFQVVLDDVPVGTRYKYRLYRLDGTKELADPASRYQPQGVHGPSELVSNDFRWRDQHWHGIPIETYVIYELHVGTFTAEGTFDAVIPHLAELATLGITAIEIMPVAQFPGERNWGYDGAYPFAVQNSYGGPQGLKRLVDACHRTGLAAILDVVYNHLGPEGNYLPEFAPYFTERYKTPWGPAVNFDDAHSDDVRHYFLSNAHYWITDFHMDALRLDAVHEILDHSPLNFLEELAGCVHDLGTELNRRIYCVAEGALNDTRLIRSAEVGGYGLDAQWNDDFHHSLHALMTGEDKGYYVDFGNFQHMAQAFSEGFVYAGRYSASRKRRHGNSSREIPPQRFIVFAQNHDQIGNRMIGERLSQLVSLERYKLAVAAVLLSPFIPLLFMGDEYGETAPFQYFVSHSDPDLIDAVRRGRHAEFEAFNWQGEPPDPQGEATFHRSKLNHKMRNNGAHKVLLTFHAELIRFRRALPALRSMSKERMDVVSLETERVLIVRRWHSENEVLTLFNFNDDSVRLPERVLTARWTTRLDSADERWLGPGRRAADELHPMSVVLMERRTD